MARKNWRFQHCASPMNRHHRVKRSDPRRHDERFIETVPEKLHMHFHALFPENDAAKIANFLNDVWIDPAYILVCHRVHDPSERQNFENASEVDNRFP